MSNYLCADIYHGKQDEKVGYTQSFMILGEQPDRLPVVTHRCSDRIMFAEKPWEMPHKFPTPCVFITGLIGLAKQPDRLLASYGAADERVAMAVFVRSRLITHVRRFDGQGKRRGMRAGQRRSEPPRSRR